MPSIAKPRLVACASLVRYVLTNDPRQTIAEETRVKVHEAAHKRGYQPYASPRSLWLCKSTIVLVVWQDSIVDTTSAPTIEALAVAVAKVRFSHLGFFPEQEQLSTNLAPVAAGV